MGKRTRARAKRRLDDPAALFAEGDRHREMGKRQMAQIKAQRTELSADELPVFGCDHCRDRGRPTDWHDWTMECSVCGKCFSYSGCSCPGCCGGGRTTYTV